MGEMIATANDRCKLIGGIMNGVCDLCQIDAVSGMLCANAEISGWVPWLVAAPLATLWFG